MHAYTHTHTHTHAHTHARTHTHTHAHARTHTHLQINAHSCLRNVIVGLHLRVLVTAMGTRKGHDNDFAEVRDLRSDTITTIGRLG